MNLDMIYDQIIPNISLTLDLSSDFKVDNSIM